MTQLLTILVFTGPFVYFAFDYAREYGLESYEWSIPKAVAIGMFFIYLFWIVVAGWESVVNSETLRRQLLSGFIFPGLAFSCVIFPKSVSETFDNYIALKRAGLHEAVASYIGWFYIVYWLVWLLFIVR